MSVSLFSQSLKLGAVCLAAYDLIFKWHFMRFMRIVTLIICVIVRFTFVAVFVKVPVRVAIYLLLDK